MTSSALALSLDRIHVGGAVQKGAGLIGEEPEFPSNWPHPAAPDGNPFVRNDASTAELAARTARAQLGKALFWDEQVSTDNTVACGTCHFISAGGTDVRTAAIASNGAFGAPGTIPQRINSATGLVDFGGATPSFSGLGRDVTPTNPPTMIGAYLFNRLFWDMRAGPAFHNEVGVPISGFGDWAALEDQAVSPPVSSVEMGHEGLAWSDGRIQAKLNAAIPLELVDASTIPSSVQLILSPGQTYAELFDTTFADDPQYGGNLGVTRERFGMAVATYMRTLIPDQAPLDTGMMTQQEIDGFNLMDMSDCFFCHSISRSPTLNEHGVLAEPFDNALSNGSLQDIRIGTGLRKVPTLRNVGLRKKFFSDGKGGDGSTTLAGVIRFYDNREGVEDLQGLNLKPNGTLTSAEFAAVEAFLGHALTDPRVAAETFPFDRPQLASERKQFKVFEGNEYGVGLAYNGHLPEIIANGLPKVSAANFGSWPNAHFKIGVGDAAPLSPAFLMIGDQKMSGLVLVGGTVTTAAMVFTDANGVATAQAPVPLLPGTIGVPFFTQWLVSEGGNASLSNAASFTPF